MRFPWELLAGAFLMMTACADTTTRGRPGFDPEAHPMFTQSIVSGLWISAAAAHVVERRCGGVPDDLRAELVRHDAEIASVMAAEMPPWYMRAADGLLREFEDYPACEDRAMETIVGYGGLAARELVADLHTGGNASRLLPLNAPARTGGDLDADLHPEFAQSVVSGQWIFVGLGHVVEQRCRLLPNDLREELARHYGEIRSALAGAGLPAWWMKEAERQLSRYEQPDSCGTAARSAQEALTLARILVADMHRTGSTGTDRPMSP